MKKPDIDAIREAWLLNTEAEADLWLSHIDRRTKEILDMNASDRVAVFETGELLFNVFSYLNWLAHIHFREAHHVKEDKHPNNKDMISFLQSATKWPREACEAFWFIIRNPLMHTGRTSLFAKHERKSSVGNTLFADVHPDLTFDPRRFQPDEYKPGVEDDGFIALPPDDSDTEVVVWFYFPGIRRKLQDAKEFVLDGIRTADDQSILGLRKINTKTLAFRISASTG